MQRLKAAGPQTKHIQSVYRNGHERPFNSKLVADETTVILFNSQTAELGSGLTAVWFRSSTSGHYSARSKLAALLSQTFLLLYSGKKWPRIINLYFMLIIVMYQLLHLIICSKIITVYYLIFHMYPNFVVTWFCQVLQSVISKLTIRGSSVYFDAIFLSWFWDKIQQPGINDHLS